MGVSTLEKAPKGFREPWLGYWRASLAQLKLDGTWRVSMRPLLDGYVLALRRAVELRDETGDNLSFGERLVAADREERRAIALAEKLGLTVMSGLAVRSKPRKVDDGPDNDTADIPAREDVFSELDELRPRREKRTPAA